MTTAKSNPWKWRIGREAAVKFSNPDLEAIEKVRMQFKNAGLAL
jgi:hypothetical protein